MMALEHTRDCVFTVKLFYFLQQISLFNPSLARPRYEASEKGTSPFTILILVPQPESTTGASIKLKSYLAARLLT